MNKYWFFLSYSSGNNDELLGKFSTDLVEELRKIIPNCDEDEPIGFRDRKDIVPGKEWRNSLQSALQTSRVLICLYSEPYFGSEYCGKEFQVFSDRLTAFAAAGNAAELIIPILWSSPKLFKHRLPAIVKTIQFKHEDLGDLYAKYGLYHLMKIGGPDNEIAYNQVLLYLRDLIYTLGQTAAQMQPLNPAPSIKSVQNAFQTEHLPPKVSSYALTELPPAATLPVAKGHDVAWFVYIAGRKGDYQQVRNMRQYYGQDGGYDWKPYLPDEPERIAKIATVVASRTGFQPETLLMTKNLVTDLRDAEANNTPVVIVLDPWVLKLNSYKDTLREFDAQRLATSMVLVVWNGEDQETQDHLAELHDVISKTFPHTWESKEVFRPSIFSGRDLRKELRAVLKTISLRILQRPNPTRPVAVSPGTFPKLNSANVTPRTNDPMDDSNLGLPVTTPQN